MNKKSLSEEDIKMRYITKAVQLKHWRDEQIRMEVPITAGQVRIKGNLRTQGRPKRADYLLYGKDGMPLAVVEAKDNTHLISFGMQQAKTYAQMMDLKFAYSSNGDGFQEFDFLTGKEQTLALSEFPTEMELLQRIKEEANGGSGLSEAERKIIVQPYYTGPKTFAPRYYQRVAVDRTVEAYARGKKRLLLVMATGTGKTYTAFQIVYRLLKAGLIHKVLYLADRNVLIDQTIEGDFYPLIKEGLHKVNYAKDKVERTKLTASAVYFSLYQQLIGEKGEERFKELFDPDFFDLIIVDECHRGSAKEDSQWRTILSYFDSAAQLGMTATPKETKYASNLTYFGEPLYTYSLNQGIQDGFLAPFRVIQVTTNIGEGWRPRKGQVDIYGHEIPDRYYTNQDYDYNVVLEDRIRQVAEDITDYLKQTDRMSKTIVFCAKEDHAERMRVALSKCNQDMVQKYPNYVVRITGSDEYGKSQLDYFKSVSAKTPVIATTSKLLSTGVNCKTVKLIVLDQWITSMTEFKQIIGRGTRLEPRAGKWDFTVMDFRNVSALFADPDWDGPVIVDPGFPGGPDPYGGGGGRGKGGVDEPPEIYNETPIVNADGCRVQILQRTVSIYDDEGKLLRQESITDYTKTNVRGKYATLRDFIQNWKDQDKKEAIRQEFRELGIDFEKMKAEQNMTDVDDYDFICYVAYGERPMTRKERAEAVKKGNFFTRYSGAAKEVLEALLEKYKDSGIYDLEETSILKIAPFNQFGSPANIARLFGSGQGYKDAVKELETEIYKMG